MYMNRKNDIIEHHETIHWLIDDFPDLRKQRLDYAYNLSYTQLKWSHYIGYEEKYQFPF